MKSWNHLIIIILPWRLDQIRRHVPLYLYKHTHAQKNYNKYSCYNKLYMQQWILIWFSEHCFITVTPTFNIFFRNNLCCVQWPTVIITKYFWYQRRKSNSFHTQKVKRVFWLLFFLTRKFDFLSKDNFQTCKSYKDLWLSN